MVAHPSERRRVRRLEHRFNTAFRPALEALEAREVPAAYYWLGSAPGGGWGTAANWTLDPINMTPAPHAPMGFGDDLYFDGTVSNAGCPGSGGSGMYNSLNLVNGYSATVNIGYMQVNNLTLTGGTIDQMSAFATLMVYNSFTWTDGTLNSTGNLATVTITGSTTTGLIEPVGGGTLNLGSNLNLVNGAVVTAKEGTLNLLNDGIDINISENCGLLVDPGPTHQFTVESSFPIINGQQINIATNAVQTLGTTILPHDERTGLSLSEGMLMSGGTLAIQVTDGGMAYTGPARIVLGALNDKTLTITGGDIIYTDNVTGGSEDEHVFATFRVVGNVNWTGGTYRPWVSAFTNYDGDLWQVSHTFTIGGTAAVVPTAVNADNVVVTPPANKFWYLFEAGNGITAANNTPSLGATWQIIKDPNNPSLWWNLRSL